MTDEATQSDAPEDYAPPVTRGGHARRVPHNGGTKGNVGKQMQRWRGRNRSRRAEYMRRWRTAQRRQSECTPCHAL